MEVLNCAAIPVLGESLRSQPQGSAEKGHFWECQASKNTMPIQRVSALAQSQDRCLAGREPGTMAVFRRRDGIEGSMNRRDMLEGALVIAEYQVG